LPVIVSEWGVVEGVVSERGRWSAQSVLRVWSEAKKS